MCIHAQLIAETISVKVVFEKIYPGQRMTGVSDLLASTVLEKLSRLTRKGKSSVFVTQEDLASCCRCEIKSVKRALKVLEQCGLIKSISVTKRQDDGTIVRLPNEYHLLFINQGDMMSSWCNIKDLYMKPKASNDAEQDTVSQRCISDDLSENSSDELNASDTKGWENIGVDCAEVNEILLNRGDRMSYYKKKYNLLYIYPSISPLQTEIQTSPSPEWDFPDDSITPEFSNSNQSSTDDSDERLSFTYFWKLFRRPVGKGNKSKAEKLWIALSDEIKLIVIDDLESRLNPLTGDPAWNESLEKNRGKFIPMPEVYLRNKRWEEEWEPATSLDVNKLVAQYNAIAEISQGLAPCPANEVNYRLGLMFHAAQNSVTVPMTEELFIQYFTHLGRTGSTHRWRWDLRYCLKPETLQRQIDFISRENAA